MAVSDFFEKFTNKLVKKKLSKIYQPAPLNLSSGKQNSINNYMNMHEEAPDLERISYLAKTLKSRRYVVECLKSKK